MTGKTENMPVDDWRNFYGPIILTGDGRTLRPGDEGWDEAKEDAVIFPAPDMDTAKIIGWASGNIEVVMHADGTSELYADEWHGNDA